MKNFLIGALLAAMTTGTAQAAVVATLEETQTGGVMFSLDVTNPDNFDYSGFSAKHLEYIFFDNLGDYVNGPLLGNNNNPTIFQPQSHGLVGQSSDGFTIGIQAIALDNDDQNPNDADDFVLRFIGQTTGLTNNVTPLNFQTFLDYDPVLIRNLSFDVLNEGIFTSNDAQAQALGGFTLEVKSYAPVAVPLPASAFSLIAGLGALGCFARKRAKAKTKAECAQAT
ncbi:VPLPA-CTERM sorting domain-containing protein [uncultured Roseibium sp.]|uniref:VPLPA-CTERM sorting domain-containing protein n=1 Tax=uncultured Roseibium sp. TaxID=1936171 RepID=UPI00260F7607|nr:VPLPA-CTERM sorting domain-containing protein [uncultured Roseibium sp.]